MKILVEPRSVDNYLLLIIGVYPGCGSACVILNKPCNYGDCIDEYDSFKCNCSTSPNDGKFCQNETNSMKFSGGQFLTYDLQMANISEKMAQALIVVGFKTTTADAALAQLEGTFGRHFSLCLLNGYLTLFYTQKDKREGMPGVRQIPDRETMVLQILDKKLNDGKHNVVKVHITTGEVFLTAENHNLRASANVTERLVEESEQKKTLIMDAFGAPVKFHVGKLDDFDINAKSIPQTYSGCMSGAKLVFNPFPTATKKYRKSHEIDMFGEYVLNGKKSKNPFGTPPTKQGYCGAELPIPGVLPSVGPAQQFFTDSPGLDNSVTITNVDTLNHILIMAIVVIISVLLLVFLYFIYKFINKSQIKYRELKPKGGKGGAIPIQSMKPAPTSELKTPTDLLVDNEETQPFV